MNLNEFEYRTQDPQIGRFIQTDPIADLFPYNSTYSYAENRPIDGIDIEGLEYLRAGENLIFMNVTIESSSAKKLSGGSIRMYRDNLCAALKAYLIPHMSTNPNEPDLTGVGAFYYKNSLIKTADQGDATEMKSTSIGPLDVVHENRSFRNKKELSALEKSKEFTREIAMPGNSTGTAIGDGILAMIELTKQFILYQANKDIESDMKTISIQNKMAQKVFADINIGLRQNIITPNYKNSEALSALANHMLFGQKPMRNTGMYNDYRALTDFINFESQIKNYEVQQQPSLICPIYY